MSLYIRLTKFTQVCFYSISGSERTREDVKGKLLDPIKAKFSMNIIIFSAELQKED